MNAIVIKEKEITYLALFNKDEYRRSSKEFLTNYYKTPYKKFSMQGYLEILKTDYSASIYELATQDNILLTNTLLIFFQSREDKRAAEIYIKQNKLTKDEIVDAAWEKYNADAIYEVNEF